MAFPFFGEIMEYIVLCCNRQAWHEDPSEGTSAEDNLRAFTLEQLKEATNNFSNLIGKGSSGEVFLGMIEDLYNPIIAFTQVAVKMMTITDYETRDQQWLAEVKVLSQLSHHNIVKLIGYCQEKSHHHLVYEYMSNRSLDKHLYNKDNMQYIKIDDTRLSNRVLPWATRVKIAHGAAMGLRCLHNQKPPICYRDFRSSNILLDENYNAKVSYFGFAMEKPHELIMHEPSRLGSIFGSSPPGRGKQKIINLLSMSRVKLDIYHFGVVLLEILTGQDEFGNGREEEIQVITNWANWYFLNDDKSRICEILDPALEGQYEMDSVSSFAKLAVYCILEEELGLDMNSVAQTLGKILSDLDESTRRSQARSWFRVC